MTWDQGSQWRSDDRLAAGGSRTQLVLPITAGVVGGLVVHLALYTVILAMAFALSDTGSDFTTGDALVWGTLGAIGLAVATAACAWIIRRMAGNREVGTETGQRAALFTAVVFAALVIILGVAPGLRIATLPVYVVIVLGGAFIGSGRPGRL